MTPKLAPKLHAVASRTSRTIELPNRDIAWKVYESLPESSVIELLLSSEKFADLCRLESRKVSQRAGLLSDAMRKRSEWLRDDALYAATVFVQCWPEYRPPKWVMDWLRQGLLDFLEEKGSLASVLGFTERAPKSAKRRERLLTRFVDISRLRALGLNVKEAAGLVCCRDNLALRGAEDSESADHLVSMTNSLAAEYHRYPGRDELTQLYKLMRTKKTDEEIADSWLSDFPRNEVLRIPALQNFWPR